MASRRGADRPGELEENGDHAKSGEEAEAEPEATFVAGRRRREVDAVAFHLAGRLGRLGRELCCSFGHNK